MMRAADAAWRRKSFGAFVDLLGLMRHQLNARDQRRFAYVSCQVR